jgi:hypothetical protein
MPSFTPENIRARKIALWICSAFGLVVILVLTNRGAISARLYVVRNPIAIISILMLFTGIMHAPRKELRIPSVALSVVAMAVVLILFLATGHS